jgi:hypothetical protein
VVDIAAAVFGGVWDIVLLALLIRSRRSAVFIVVAFALMSLYTVDRALPRALVDAWPNFDAAHSPALRPIVTIPDLVLVGAVMLGGRFPTGSWTWVIAGALVLAAATGVATTLLTGSAPISAALFWATVPLRGALVVVLIAQNISRSSRSQVVNHVLTAVALGGAVLATELLAVVVVKALAASLGYDLAAVWSGFDWIRPNLPGWNNNIAASAVALGGAAIVLAPSRVLVPQGARLGVLVIMGLSLLAAEYRTAIIGLALAIGLRASGVVWDRLPRAGAPVPTAAAISAIAGLVVASVLLASTALVVPRMGDLNPVAYLARAFASDSEVVAPADDEPPPPVVNEEDTSSTSRAEILRAALTVWERNRLVGGGLGAWEFDRPTQPSFLQKQITPHNGYAWALADLGLLGLAAIFVIPGVLVAMRRPPLRLLGMAVLLALLEVSIVGIAHARYSVAYWAVLSTLALVAWTGDEDSRRSDHVPTVRPAAD